MVVAAPPFDYPKLQRLVHVQGAVAAGTQRTTRQPIAYPRGFANGHAQVHTSMAPSERSALWFRELHAGFRSANFLHYSTQVGDGNQILVAETLELQRAAVGAPRVDDCQPYRSLAVWVVVEARAAVRPNGPGQRVLDAVAHLATGSVPLTQCVRVGIATGAMAVTILNNAAKEGANCTNFEQVAWSLAVRWADANGATHSVMAPLGDLPCTTDAALERVQRALCVLLARYERPVPPPLVARFGPVPPDAFASQSTRIDGRFADQLEALPVCVRSRAVEAAGAAPLENTGIFVRVCERKRGDDGVAHASAFHGVLLSFGSSKATAAAFANAADPALTCPVGHTEESMGLHLCAVQAEACALSTSVSLFSHVGRPGEAIHPPGSHVFRECAAIRPVDAELLMHWDLRPCDRSSTLPENVAYHAAFQEHFSRAAKLYLSLSDGAPRAAPLPEPLRHQRSYSSSNHLDALVCAPAVDDAHTDRDDAALRLALHIDLRSRRTTIGEAYAYLFDKGMPAALSSTMVHAMGRLGVRASLDDMFRLASATLAQQESSATINVMHEASRLKRLSDVCLQALATEDARKRARPGLLPVSAPERVRRMLATLGIKKGSEAVLAPNMNDPSVTRAVAVVVEALTHLAPNGTFMRRTGCETEPFGPCRVDPTSISQEHWIGIADSVIACVATVVLLCNELGGTVYMITSVAKSGALTIQRLEAGPQCRRKPASFDDLIATPRERTSVLLLQHLDDDERKCKLSATVPIPAPPPKAAA